MKTLTVTAMLALLAAPAAFAQDDSSNARQNPDPALNAPVPFYQQGSGQQSGGYANELNSPTGVFGAPLILSPGNPVVTLPPGAVIIEEPVETGSILEPDVYSNDDLQARRGNDPSLDAPVPFYQRGSGEQSGGYANELIPR